MSCRRSCPWLLLAGLLAAPAPADDIDIYLRRGIQAPGGIRVMLALDFRQGAGGDSCADASLAACRAHLGPRLHDALDLYGPGVDGTGDPVIRRGADGVPDLVQPDPLDPGRSLADSHWPGAPVHSHDLLRALLRAVLVGSSARLAEIPDASVEVGLMLPHHDDCEGAGPAMLPDYRQDRAISCSMGAYVLQGFVDIAEPDRLALLLEKLAAIPAPGARAPWMERDWSGHRFAIRDIYFELFRYLTGQPVFNGFLGASDFGSRMSGNLYHRAAGAVANDVLPSVPGGSPGRPLLAPDTAIMDPASLDLNANDLARARYRSPLESGGACTRWLLVNALSGGTGMAHGSTDAAIAAPYRLGGLLPGLSVAGESGDLAAVAALYDLDLASGRFPGVRAIAGVQNVTSHFLVAGPGEDAGALAAAGGQTPILTLDRPQAALAGLEALFDGVVSVSTSVVAASAPFDNRDLARHSGELFFAMFQPAAGPRWNGNIKKLRVVELDAPDPNSNGYRSAVRAAHSGPPLEALSAVDGRIAREALTFWTDPEGADVRAHDHHRGEVAGRDGRSVDRGGAGQRIPGYLADAVGDANEQPGARQLYTEHPEGGLLALDADMSELALISDYLDPAGQLDEAGERRLLRWIRGQDAYDRDADGDRFESRRWLLGDPLHSRPLPINYGARPGTGYSRGNPDIRLFFGANDGFFRMLENTGDNPAGGESGRETWAFIPLELLAMQADLARNQPRAMLPHPYGMDGEAAAYVEDRDRDGDIEPGEGDRVWVFIGQRRGGRALYAFDMSDPDEPRLKWKIDHRSAGFEQLAMTFSTPRVAMLDYDRGIPRPTLIFGGGYNGGWRGSARIGKDAGSDSDTIGNAIYVVDADSGELVWSAVGPNAAGDTREGDGLFFAGQLTDSIPSPVTLVDADLNGRVDRAYVGDTGGNVWRLQLTEYRHREEGTDATAAANWHLTRLASLGGEGAGDRRFFHPPDYVRARDGSGDYLGVVIVSGNRAAPLDVTVEDFAYLLKDRPADPGEEEALIGEGELTDITALCSGSDPDGCRAADLGAGWKLALTEPGEKGLSSPLVLNGVVMFTSYVPDTDPPSCEPGEGHSRLYRVALADGAPAAAPTRTAQHLPQRHTPIGAGLSGDVLPHGDGVLLPGRTAEGSTLVHVPGRNRWRVYWREEHVDWR